MDNISISIVTETNLFGVHPLLASLHKAIFTKTRVMVSINNLPRR